MWRDSGVASNVSSAKRGFPRPVIDVLVLELGCELGGEVVHLHDDPANAGNEKVVTEHCRDRHAQRDDCGYESARNTGAIATRLGEPASATPVNASITPQTVPSNPKKGEPLTAVASRIICDSSESPVSPTARSIATLTAPICAGEILSAISSRARKVSSTSAEPSRWNVISSQPAR